MPLVCGDILQPDGFEKQLCRTPDVLLVTVEQRARFCDQSTNTCLRVGPDPWHGNRCYVLRLDMLDIPAVYLSPHRGVTEARPQERIQIPRGDLVLVDLDSDEVVGRGQTGH